MKINIIKIFEISKNSFSKMKMNKKGILFTILTIAILSLSLVSYSIYSDVKERESINKRIETMNNFIFSLEKDMSRQLYIAGYRIIVLLEKRIIEKGVSISNLNSSFEECFFNRTLYGEPQELMNGVTFDDISDFLNQRAGIINLELSLSPHKLSVSQDDPWNVKISLETDIVIKDRGNLVFWNKTEIISSYIPIENFEDPLYVINTNGKVLNKINKTVYMLFVQGTDVSNLTAHVKNSYYIASSLAPSFLDRFEGKTSANANGIESLVYLPKLYAQGIPILDKSVVDYIYFSSNNPDSHGIQGMYSWFKLDDAHLNVYGVSGLAL